MFGAVGLELDEASGNLVGEPRLGFSRVQSDIRRDVSNVNKQINK